MTKTLRLALIFGWLAAPQGLQAQQVCPGLPYMADTPEDELMQAVNGAENPQEQIAALDKYAQAHADAKFIPCVHEYYTMAYLKLNQYDQALDHGEKGLAGSYQDMMLIMNLVKAYLASGKVGDPVFAALIKAPEQIKAESNPPKPPNVSDPEWQKTLQDLADQGKDMRNYLEYAFLQLLPRVPDGMKRVQILDDFMKAYPDTSNAGQMNLQYFVAYKLANNAAKADEFGEKAVAADPTNVATLNILADDYATQTINLDKAAEYAKKAADLAPTMKKPDGMTDDLFKTTRDSQMGLAHATLGYVAYLKGAKTHKVGPAIPEFKTAIDLLGGNPALQARTLYYLGYAYEVIIPANHKLAADALARAAAIPSPWQGQAQSLLAKVKAAGQ